MTLRSLWLESVSSCEPAAMAKAESLLEAADQPDDIRYLARQLGASIVSLHDGAEGDARLRRGLNGGWDIEIKGDISGDLNPEQRFSVAHEMAHILFIDSRIAVGPCSEEEYWILEKACDRVASRLCGSG